GLRGSHRPGLQQGQAQLVGQHLDGGGQVERAEVRVGRDGDGSMTALQLGVLQASALAAEDQGDRAGGGGPDQLPGGLARAQLRQGYRAAAGAGDRKSTRLNSSHVKISYAVFCLKKKTSASLIR